MFHYRLMNHLDVKIIKPLRQPDKLFLKKITIYFFIWKMLFKFGLNKRKQFVYFS